MTEKELKKLSRIELLELLIEQTERCEELERKLAEAEQEIKNQSLNVKEVGTLAEACLKVNKIFESADAAAKQYLANIKVYDDKKKDMLAETQRRCAEMEREAEMKVAALKADIDLLSRRWIKPAVAEEEE